MADKELLSVVITSYTMDRLKDIVELLHSIRVQTYSNIEIIFVAERSKALLEQIQRYATENTATNMKVIFNDGEMGMSAARNLGIKNAQGDIIAFVDDDALPSPDWAEEMVRTYKDSSIIAVSGTIIPLWEDETMTWFPDELDWLIGCSRFSAIYKQEDIRNVWGANMSFRREAFNLAGVFSQTIGAIQGKRLHGEETEFSLRIRRATKRRIVYNPKVSVKHKVYRRRLSLRAVARSSFWIGYTRRVLKKVYSNKEDEDAHLLDVEHKLLRRILTGLFPNIAKGFFTNPIIAYRKLSLTLTALTCVAIGYYWQPFSIFDNKKG